MELTLSSLTKILDKTFAKHGDIKVIMDHEDFFGQEFKPLKDANVEVKEINGEKKLVISCID